MVITEASILRTNEEDKSLVLEYNIEQLGSQDEVSSIEEFVGLDHQDCSIFVDDFASYVTIIDSLLITVGSVCDNDPRCVPTPAPIPPPTPLRKLSFSE